MPRPPRIDIGDIVYHVINRANNRREIFQTDSDYKMFEELLEEIVVLRDMRIIAYCIMPNHWHLILHPRVDGQLSSCMHWLTTTHSRRWLASRKVEGGGHVYQGRYKSFLVEEDAYLLQVIRYVERNPVRAKLVSDAKSWKYSSLFRRGKRDGFLSDTLIDLPNHYLEWVNEPEDNIEQIRKSVHNGIPFGSDNWLLDTKERFNLKFDVGMDNEIVPRGYEADIITQ